MLRILAILFGLVMIAAGILGFMPDFVKEGKLLGVFSVNDWHNAIHLATGIISLLCGFWGSSASKIFFILFGLVYLTITALGFMQGEGTLFGLVAINGADNWLHLAISIVSLYFGLFIKSK